MNFIHLPGYRNPVLIESIVWLEGEASYTRVHYQTGTFAIVTLPLRWFEYQLDFIRVHRSAIVNPLFVKEFVQKRGRTGWIRLINERVIAISRTRLERTAIRLQCTIDKGPFSHTRQLP